MQQEHDRLYNSLSDEDKTTVNSNGTYFSAGYDPPFKLFFRRNEIWMIRRLESEFQTSQINEVAPQECTTST